MVNEGRITTGSPSSATVSRTSSIEWHTRERGTSSPAAQPAPALATISLNSWRSSPRRIASMLAPISSTPNLSSTPASCSATAVLSAVCPPSVASSASGRSRAITFSTNSGGDRLDVGRVGELGVGHDGGRVGVDQRHPQALGPQHLAGLGAGVVELAGLPDHDRPGADDEDVAEIGPLRHACPPQFARRVDQLDEPVKEVVGVVRAGRGLRVVLHRERGYVQRAQPLDDVVVEADVAHLDRAELGFEPIALRAGRPRRSRGCARSPRPCRWCGPAPAG